MTASDVEKLAREAKLYYSAFGEDWNALLNRFAALVEARTMERAAQLCEAHAAEPQAMVVTRIDDNPRDVVSRECAATIRFAITASRAVG